MIERALDLLDAFRQEAGFAHSESWLRYFELGGMSTGYERFVELGASHPVAYSCVLNAN